MEYFDVKINNHDFIETNITKNTITFKCKKCNSLLKITTSQDSMGYREFAFWDANDHSGKYPTNSCYIYEILNCDVCIIKNIIE